MTAKLATDDGTDGLVRVPDGAVTVPTPTFVLAQTVARRAVADAEIAGFFGEPGTGKTHALREFQANAGVETIYVTASPSPQAKEIFEEILLGAGYAPDDVSVRQLRRDCQEVLAERPRALIVDECQHLSYLWHQQLRSLHDHPSAKFALLLGGGSNVVRKLKGDPQLWSRIEMRVTFERLEGQVLLNTLAAYHPVLAKTDPTLLAEIDARDCRGNFRDWAHILQLALGLLPGSAHPDRLTDEVVRAVFALRGTS